MWNKQFQNRADPNRRRDGSQASKAKSNKTIDYECVYQNQFDPIFRMRCALDPSFSIQTSIPPLEQYERSIHQIPPVLTKYVNRRKCEQKQQRERLYVDVTFAKYNPDGRFLLVGSNAGIVYIYNSYDFSFHYQYMLQTRKFPVPSLTGLAFHPNNSNAAFVSNDKGQIHYYDNLLHYDISMHDQAATIFQDQKLNSIAISSCGSQLVTGCENGQLATVETHRRQAPSGVQKYKVFDKSCNDAIFQSHGKQLIIAAGEKIKLIDQRVNRDQMIVSGTYYKQFSEEPVNKLAMHVQGNLLAAAGSDGCRIFDIRNMSEESYRCLYSVKPKNETSVGSCVMWHPVYPDVFVVGDEAGDINFYDLNYTNASYGFEKLFENNFTENFKAEFTQQPEVGQTHNLYSIGYVHAAHRSQKGQGTALIDMDIHPSGNSLGTTGKDKDVRFWTYPGSGNLQNDIFHGNIIDPAAQEFQFNQSHKELQSEQDELEKKIKDIERMERNQNEDIFSREEVQLQMKQYVSTADERQREAEEADFIREREGAGRRI
ncbi:Collagen_alpha 1 chain [Hexamita inflata]|uniref:Collagen_alpha 1 chain n=1 Tax=Hexamita inflata TaxID=28002 RepID=A0ABP1IKX2_9EUKA